MQTTYLSLLKIYMLFYNMILMQQYYYYNRHKQHKTTHVWLLQRYQPNLIVVFSYIWVVEAVSTQANMMLKRYQLILRSLIISKIFILNCMQKSNIMHILMMVFITNELKGYSTSLPIIIFKVHHLLHASLKLKTYMLNQTLILNMSLAHNKNNGR